MMNSTTPMTATAQLSTEIHLLAVDPCDRPEGPSPSDSARDSSALAPLVVPSGVSSLDWNTPAGVSLSPASGHAPRLEALLSRPNEPCLLLASSPQCRASINGLPAPRLALLSEGDRFHFDAGPAFRVALFHRPRLGPAPAEVIGVSCPVCTLALTEGDRCLVCSCGTPLHAAEDESREGALACVRVVTLCPHCQQPVRLVPGYGELSQPDHD